MYPSRPVPNYQKSRNWAFQANRTNNLVGPVLLCGGGKSKSFFFCERGALEVPIFHGDLASMQQESQFYGSKLYSECNHLTLLS